MTTLDFCAKVDLLKTKKKKKKYINMESVVSDRPARTAQADPKRQFKQMSECLFSRATNHIMDR